MFNKIYEIKYSDTDEFMRLKPSVFFEYLEDVAAKNADSMDFGYESIYSQGLGWFLLKYVIEIYAYPKNLSHIKIETEPRGTNRHFVYRDFAFYDDKENLIGKAASTWALMDLKNKSMLNPKETLGEKIWEFEKREDDIKYNKIPQIQPPALEKLFDVRFDDIDVNMHVNNSRYILWALECLPVEILKEKSIKRIDIQYKKDITYGNIISSNAQIIDNKSIHSIKNNSTKEDLCNLLIEWN